MSQFDKVFGDGKYHECPKCGSLTKIDEQGKLMRMILNTEGIPIIYEEINKEAFIDNNGNLNCICPS